MSSFLFYSPPQSTLRFFGNTCSTLPFDTQERRFAFSPQTPSPLRTSKNVNIMSPRNAEAEYTKMDEENVRSKATSHEASHLTLMPLFSEADSNFTSASHASSAPVTFATPQQFTPASFSPSSTSALATASSDQALRASQFQIRSRQSSPSAQLSSHMRENRDNRKRLFLGRLRSKRDEARDERGEQQILRSEYLRQKRSWEEFKRKEGMQQLEPDDWDLELEIMPHIQDEPSPLEEREIEELASYYIQDQIQTNTETSYQDGSLDEFMDDDVGYDEAFMEVLSQQHDLSKQHSHTTAAKEDTAMALDYDMT